MLSGENRNGNKKGIQESLGASLGSWEESVSHDVILRRPDSLGMGSEFQEYVNRQSFWVASNSLPPPPSRHEEKKISMDIGRWSRDGRSLRRGSIKEANFNKNRAGNQGGGGRRRRRRRWEKKHESGR